MTLLAILYYSIREYRLETALKKINSDLIKLNNRILNGDLKAAQSAMTTLGEKDKLNIEFQK